jgi:hypothetical protein
MNNKYARQVRSCAAGLKQCYIVWVNLLTQQLYEIYHEKDITVILCAFYYDSATHARSENHKNCCFQNSLPADNFKKYMACFKRRASDVPSALETIDNEAF